MTTPADIIRAAAEVGIEIMVEKNRLALTGDVSHLTDDLRAAIRREAHGIHISLTGRVRACPRLSYYVPKGSRVTTAHGEGEVLQVFADRITVLVDGEMRARFCNPNKITLHKT